MKYFIICLLFIQVCPGQRIERADIVVAKDGSGDFTTIQAALNAVADDNNSLKIILIKNGVYNEQIRIDKNSIALVGEHRDSTRIEFYKPYDFDSSYTVFGKGIINIYANDITLANLSAVNTQTNVNIHAFVVYGANNTRTIIINCNMLSNGGDTVSLWNGESGMYYHNTCYFKGAVDFLCPRGWCYAENIDFYCTRTTTPLWHDGSKNQDQKFVVKNATFDGDTNFRLGRNHLDGAFYLINQTYSDKLDDQPFFRPESSKEPYKWGRRVYFYNCNRQGGNYSWHQNNLREAPGDPKPEQITARWTFAGRWDPEAHMPAVLPFAFLPKPDNNKNNIELNPKLTWAAARNAQSYNIYFAKNDSVQFKENITQSSYQPSGLEANTKYSWRVDVVNGDEIIKGDTWQFKTASE
jgi:pectinesterase